MAYSRQRQKLNDDLACKMDKRKPQNSRVLIITDREELDGQIERFFQGVDEDIYRTKSGRDLLTQLNNTQPWLICSLIHKFGARTETATEEYLKRFRPLQTQPTSKQKATCTFLSTNATEPNQATCMRQ